MQLADLAKTVVFGETLESKLTRPGPLRDERRGDALEGAVPTPGRPSGMGFATRATPWPKGAALRTQEGRAAVLHAFANHELLAIELMGLALLRFPDAPSAWRWDLARTLVEEQRHLRAYVAQMQTMGLTFGDLPLNGWFWHVLHEMQHPRDVATCLSLTFEQANLDHARYWRKAFEALGDAPCAALMDRVYRDEIRHVAHGVRWFEQLGGQGGASMYPAWRRELPHPMTTARARGPQFDRDGRLEAGLPSAYVDALEASGGSRGRVPDLWVADLMAEARLAGAPPRQIAQEVAADLAPLVAVFTREGDDICVPRPPELPHRLRWARAGLPRPTRWHATHTDVHGDYNTLRSWSGCAHGTHATLREAPVPTPAAWFRKDHDHQLMMDVNGRDEREGVVVHDMPQLEAAVHACASSHVVLKWPLGTAGRAQQVFECVNGVPSTLRAWCTRGLTEQGAVRVEPWLPRLIDLSIQLDTRKRKPVLGISRALNTAGGQFTGLVLGRCWDGLPPEAQQALHGATGLLRAARDHAALVGRHLADAGVQTRVAIDAFVYGASWSDAQLRPMVELNPRHTFGHVGWALSRHLAGGTVAVMRIWSMRELKQAHHTPQSFLDHVLAHPLQVAEDGLTWVGGALCLTEAESAKRVVATLHMGPTLDEALATLPGPLERRLREQILAPLRER